MNVRQSLLELQPVLVTLAFALALTACSMPNAPATKAAASASGRISSEEALQVLLEINNGEIRQSELVAQKTRNQDVRNTAQRIIRDHRNVNQRIDSIAQSGTKLEKSPLSRGFALQAEQVREQMEGMSGKELDCYYLQKQIEQHRLSLETVRTEMQPEVKNRAIKELLASVEPALENHLQTSRDTRKNLKCSS